jgi:hypothetical protein
MQAEFGGEFDALGADAGQPALAQPAGGLGAQFEPLAAAFGPAGREHGA